MEQTNRLDLVMKRGKWHCHGWVAGERLRRSTGTDDRLKAEEIRLKWLKDGASGVKPKAVATSFSDAIDLYLHNRQNLAASSYDYVMRIKQTIGDVKLVDFDERAIETYRRKHCDGKKPITQKRDLTQLKAIINLAVERNLLTRRLKVAMPKVGKNEGKRLVYLEADERDRLLEHLKTNYSEEVGYLLQFMAHTGARNSEATKLTVDDVDLERNEVVFRSRKGSSGPIVRTVPMNAKAREAVEWMLNRYKIKEGRVFMDKNGKPHKHYINKSGKEVATRPLLEVAVAAKEVGIKKNVTPYTMRHTFASLMRKRGASLDRLRELMGHSNIEMTLVYAHLLVEDHRKDVDMLV